MGKGLFRAHLLRIRDKAPLPILRVSFLIMTMRDKSVRQKDEGFILMNGT